MPGDWTPEEQVARKERLRLDERERRASAVRNSLGSLAIEGLDPGPEAKAIFQRYIDGELTLEQTGDALRIWPPADAKFGKLLTAELQHDERPKA